RPLVGVRSSRLSTISTSPTSSGTSNRWPASIPRPISPFSAGVARVWLQTTSTSPCCLRRDGSKAPARRCPARGERSRLGTAGAVGVLDQKPVELRLCLFGQGRQLDQLQVGTAL